MKGRPFRFGFTGGLSAKRSKLLESARSVEALGYSTFGLADHFVRPMAPLIAGQAVADATSTLRITQTVLAQDFRQPAVLAKELATLDVLSEGRLQVGLGAGWLQQEYEDASIRFDSASVRIERLEESAIILKGLFGDEPFSFSGKHYSINQLDGLPKPIQRPRPPIMIGGGAKKILSAAARQADIVQLMPSNRGGRTSIDPSQFSAPAIEEKIGWIRDAAGERFGEIELSAQLIECKVTDEPGEAPRRPGGTNRGCHRTDGRWRHRSGPRRPASLTDHRRRASRRGMRKAGADARTVWDQLLRRADRRPAGSDRTGHRPTCRNLILTGSTRIGQSAGRASGRGRRRRSQRRAAGARRRTAPGRAPAPGCRRRFCRPTPGTSPTAVPNRKVPRETRDTPNSQLAGGAQTKSRRIRMVVSRPRSARRSS